MLLWRFQCIQLKIFPDTQQTLWAGVTISYTIWLCTHTWNLIVQLTHCECYMKEDSYILVTSVHCPPKGQCDHDVTITWSLIQCLHVSPSRQGPHKHSLPKRQHTPNTFRMHAYSISWDCLIAFQQFHVHCIFNYCVHVMFAHVCI